MRIGKKGFTLVEIIVSLAIMTIVAGAVGAFVIAGNNSYMRGNKELTLQEEAQLTANQLIDLIIDVERGISFHTTTGQAVDVDGNTAADNVPVAELILRNNDNVYMVRWQGQNEGAEYTSANQLYLYEAANTKDADGKITEWGDPSKMAPSLMAEYVTAFKIDLTDLEKKHKVKLDMTFVYQDKSYNVSETIKLRNTLSDEESEGYVWINGLTISPTPVTLARGAHQDFTYKFSGDSAAVKAATAQGVTWSVSKANGSACSSFIDNNGKLSVALDEDLRDGVLIVTCTSKADTSKVATAVVNVTTNVNYSISISPKTANVMQGHQQNFTCTVTKTENGKTEEVTGMAVEWNVTPISGTLDSSTKIDNGVLDIGRNQKAGTGVLQVTCALSEDKNRKDTAIVNVLPYSDIDGKYDAKLIAKTLTTYSLEDGRIGYKGEIECLPSWADYANGYPKIEWSIPEDPAQSKFTITGDQKQDESQFTATLKCGSQYDQNVRVVANVKLSEDVMVVLDIVIVIPKLQTAIDAEKPYIDSEQFVLNRNDKITCSIKNYTEDDGKVLWKIADLPSDLYSTCTHPTQHISYSNPMVGLVPLNHLGSEDKRPSDYPVNDTMDQDHGTFDLLQEHIGTTTDVWAKYYINMNQEYHVTLQAWSLDETELVAETTILIPKFDILFYNGEHTKDIKVPNWGENINVKFYGYTNTNEVNKKYGEGVTSGIGYNPIYLDGEIKGEKSNEGAEFYTWGMNNAQPSVAVKITGDSMENDFMILSFWNPGQPDIKRNLYLVPRK